MTLYTIETLAKAVANSFKLTMKENDFESFKEMKTTYDWEANDIRSEISYTAQDFLNKEYEDDIEKYGSYDKIPTQRSNERLHIMDDDSIEGSHNRVTYRQFKKMVMDHLK